MKEQEFILNRVESSGLITIDLEDNLFQIESTIIDLKDYLFQGIVLKEKDFRAELKSEDWEIHRNCVVLLTCSIDAIIPSWAYMLVMAKLAPLTDWIAIGTQYDLEKLTIDRAIDQVELSQMKDARVVIKGCGKVSQRDYAYSKLTQKLLPLVSILMYGEPCSTVPVYKRPK